MSAPASASATLIASPKPPVPPVTMAVFDAKENSSAVERDIVGSYTIGGLSNGCKDTAESTNIYQNIKEFNRFRINLGTGYENEVDLLQRNANGECLARI